jgi:predicted glycosyltransferase
VLSELELDPAQPIVVVRTPPAVSLYHRFDNDQFGAVLERLRGTQAVVLPRTPEQRAQLVQHGGFVIPQRAIDAQSLIAYADLVVSAGGTMNREAVALGTPVFTVFEGRLGAVDERLIAEGRLQRLQSPEQALVAKRAVSGSIRAAERIRRDPAVFTRLLCAPVRCRRESS